MKTILKNIVFIVFAATQTVQAQTTQLDWATSFGSAQIDQGTGVTTDDSGNVYFTGFFQGQIDFNPGPGVFQLTSSGSNDVFVVKLNADGQFIWAKNFGGIGDDRSTSITIGNNNAVAIAGSYSSTSDFDPGVGVVSHPCAGFTDGFLVKLDSAGNFQSVIVAGGSGEDQITGVTYNVSGAYVVTGYFESTINFFPGNTGTLVSAGSYDMFVASFDSTLAFDWSGRMGGITRNYGTSITSDNSGNIYVGGYFNGNGDYDPGSGVFTMTSNGSYDILYMKLNADGDFIWAKNAGGGTDDAANAIDIDINGNMYLTGYFSGIADFNPGSGVSNLTSTGSADGFVLQADTSGTPVWVKQIGGAATSQTAGLHIKSLSGGDVVLAGSFIGTVDMNPGAAVSNVSSAGLEDGFALRLTNQGTWVEHTIYGAAGFDVVHSVAEGSDESVIVAGSFTGTIDADPFGGQNQLVSAGAVDAFILTLGSSFTGVSENLNPVSIEVYPNPASEFLNISLSERVAGKSMMIYNAAGALVFEKHIGQADLMTVDIKNWNEGMYYIRLGGMEQNGSSKFVKLGTK